MAITTRDLEHVSPGQDGTLKMERGTAAAAIASAFPVVGMVILWKGTAANCPRGWKILEDVDDNFIKIASSDDEVSTTGGSATETVTVTAIVPAHAHTVPATELDHSHAGGTLRTNAVIGSVDVTDDGTAPRSVSGPAHTHENFLGQTETNGPNTATTSQVAAVDLSSTPTVTIDPPWVRLYLIEYTGEE